MGFEGIEEEDKVHCNCVFWRSVSNGFIILIVGSVVAYLYGIFFVLRLFCSTFTNYYYLCELQACTLIGNVGEIIRRGNFNLFRLVMCEVYINLMNEEYVVLKMFVFGLIFIQHIYYYIG